MTSLYRPIEAISLLRPSLLLPRIQPSSARKAHASRSAPFSTTRIPQATHGSTSPPPNAGPQRKSITLTGDTGQVRWSDLSPGEKAVRTTQQSFNLVVVVVGVVATITISTLLFTDVLSPSSKTAHFNHAVTLLRAHPQCQQLLGPGPQIAAFGEPSWSRWARNRHISSTTETDRWGSEHLRFRFYVEGPLGQGVVHVHMVRKPSMKEYEYETLAVDVKGHARVDVVAEEKKEKMAPKIFGARWW
ncbi:TIM21-domain-containing protein [Pyrenochaeta sp. DS3sAY3a]|nr:TIM21-domain-containing protein [Pyrenochaeta sp. DS3sAY3a]